VLWNARKCEVAETLIAVVMSGRAYSGNSCRAANKLAKEGGTNHGKQQN